MTDPPCERCQQLEQMLRRAETDMAELGEQLAGVQLQARRAGQAEVAIRRQLQEAMEADPKSEQIRDVLNHWQAHHPRAKTPTGGKRFVTVKKALKLGFTVEQLKQALDGLRALPYVGPAGRMAAGKPDQRFDDVEHALRDEQTIERFIGYLENPPAAASRTTDPKPSRPPLVGQAIDRVLGKLNTAKPAGLGKWTACCPAHDDQTASLSIAVGDRGVVARCFAGCTTEAIADAIGVPLCEWFDDDAPTVLRPRPVPQVLPSDATLAGWRKRLMAHQPMLDRLHQLRGWTRDALDTLDVGWDGQRLTLPVYDDDGALLNVCRYLPNGQPKMLGLSHRPRGLFPRPEMLDGSFWIVEGEPDAITAHSIGLEGVGVPGANGWRPEWATRFAGRDVVILPDCDDPGRKLADQIAVSLYGVAESVRVVDLDPNRTDGYDLSDAVREGATADVLTGMAEQVLAVNRTVAA
jgi:hypothetical protein